jgi:hypothetical protein
MRIEHNPMPQLMIPTREPGSQNNCFSIQMTEEAKIVNVFDPWKSLSIIVVGRKRAKLCSLLSRFVALVPPSACG